MRGSITTGPSPGVHVRELCKTSTVVVAEGRPSPMASTSARQDVRSGWSSPIAPSLGRDTLVLLLVDEDLQPVREGSHRLHI
jgi:hypothetical protein